MSRSKKKKTPMGAIIFIIVTLMVYGIIKYWPKEQALNVIFDSNESSSPKNKPNELALSNEKESPKSVETIEKKMAGIDSSEKFLESWQSEMHDSSKFLETCEAQLDREIEDYVSWDLEEFFSQEEIAKNKLKTILSFDLENRALAKSYDLALQHSDFLTDDLVMQNAAPLRPCRPFLVLEFYQRLAQGLGENKWSTDFSREVKRALLDYIKESLGQSQRVFNLGLTINLLNKMAELNIIPSFVQSDLKKSHERIEEFTLTMQESMENLGQDGFSKGAAKLLLQDLREAEIIRQDLQNSLVNLD